MINTLLTVYLPDFDRHRVFGFRALKILVLSSVITVISFAGAVPIGDIDVGDTYHVNHVFSENELVVVTRIDAANGRVKIQYSTGGTDWVSPSDLYTRSGARNEDVAEAVVGTALIAGALWAIFDPEGFKEAMRDDNSSSSSPTPRRQSDSASMRSSSEATGSYGSPVAISAVPFSPIVDGAWVDAGDDWRNWSEGVLRNKFGTTVQIESVNTKTIPFYSTANRKVVLAEAIQTGRTGAYYIAAVIGTKSVVVLDGKGASIHRLNKLLDFSVNSAATAESYVKFFTSAISNDKGIFVVLDSDIDYLSQESLNQIGVKSVRVYGDARKGWTVLADVIYGSHVFSAEFLVSKNGNVEMLDDAPKRELSLEYLVVMEGGRRSYVKN